MSNNKDWVGTKNSLFKMLGASNHCDEEREENDFYATDPVAIDWLLKYENFSEFVWETCCGAGHLSERLKSFGHKVFNTDIIDRGYQDFNEVLDFLTCDGWKGSLFQGDIITNPPYKYCSEFIKKSLDVVGEGRKVAMFLKLQTLEGQKRYQEIFCSMLRLVRLGKRLERRYYSKMDKQYLTIKWIIDELSKDGSGTKVTVRDTLKNASVSELLYLKRSINELIRNKRSEE